MCWASWVSMCCCRLDFEAHGKSPWCVTIHINDWNASTGLSRVAELTPNERICAESALVECTSSLRATMTFQRQTHRNNIQKQQQQQTNSHQVLPEEWSVISQLNTRCDLSDPKHLICIRKCSQHTHLWFCFCLSRCNGKHFRTQMILLRQRPAFAPSEESERKAEDILPLHMLWKVPH